MQNTFHIKENIQIWIRSNNIGDTRYLLYHPNETFAIVLIILTRCE